MLPNFFIIGAAKAGTTALHEYLDLHPEIHMSALKEPNHFAPEDLSPHGRDHSVLIADRAEYERLFESDAPMRGESSPAYSQFPRRPGVPERIHAAVPDARFIYLVRDPLERIVAFYLQRASRGDYGTLDEALGDIDDPANDYVCPSRYMTQVRRYLEFFPPGRILIIDQADLRSQRRAALTRIFEFLGVDPGFWSRALEHEVNRSAEKRAYSRAYARLSRGRLARSTYELLPPPLRDTSRRFARKALRRPLPRPELEGATRARLIEILGPEAQELREFTGQSFSGWSV